jgi:L-gulonolactone oxidase
VRRIGIVRSTGEVLELSPEQNAALFAATIGGLGLTGIMLWIELQLIPIRSASVEAETLKMPNLEGFFRLSEESANWQYTVAWVDALASGRAVGRGLFIRGRHSEVGPLATHRAPRWTVPEAAQYFLNPGTVGCSICFTGLALGPPAANRFTMTGSFIRSIPCRNGIGCTAPEDSFNTSR